MVSWGMGLSIVPNQTRALGLLVLGTVVFVGCGDDGAAPLEIDAAGIDASLPDAALPLPDAAPLPPDAQPGPLVTGSLNYNGIPANAGTIELTYSGGSFVITTSATGEFSERFPLAGENYSVFVPGPEGYWSHASWLLDVPAEGLEDLKFDLGDDAFIDGLSNVVGAPAMAKSEGIVSLDIRLMGVERNGLGFTLGVPADPVFTFSQGVPVRSPTLLGNGDSILIFGNVSPQTIEPVVPNELAAGCSQLAPASEVRAGTVLTLPVTCE